MIRKSLKRFAAVLCAALTMVSFSGTKVEAAEGDGYWMSFPVKSYTYKGYYDRNNPIIQYVQNRTETVGVAGTTARAKVKFNFSDFELERYRPTVRFIYCIDGGTELYETVAQTFYSVTPGNYEINYYKGYNDNRVYFAIRPEYYVFNDWVNYNHTGSYYITY